MLKVNQFQVKLEPHNIIKDVFYPIIDLFTAQLEQKDIKLKFNQLYKLNPHVMIDKNRVQQILINLIQNAIKFSKPKMKITLNFNQLNIKRGDSKYCSFLVSV
jgi:two-component system, OmpR family, phosphate regulon sensor histidine kinase PhoR